MTLKHFLIDALIIIIIGTGLVFMSSNKKIPEHTITTVDQHSEYAVAKGDYPQFPDLPKEFNEKVAKIVNDSIAEHQATSEENWKGRYETQDQSENITEKPADNDRFQLEIDTQVVRNDASYASVLLTIGGYTGGAHGYRNIFTVTYDRKNKKEILTSDLYTQDQLKAISETTIPKLITQLAEAAQAPESDVDAEWVRTGAGPTFENYARFVINPDNTITFYFEQYQVAAYVFGDQSITIPLQ